MLKLKLASSDFTAFVAAMVWVYFHVLDQTISFC